MILSTVRLFKIKYVALSWAAFSFGVGTYELYSVLVNISKLVIIWVRIKPLFSRVELDAEHPLLATN